MKDMDIKEILKLFSSLHIDEMVYKSGEMELELRKATATAPPAQVAPAPASSAIAVISPTALSATAPLAAPPVAPAVADPNIFVLTSPIVGTFYRSPAPGQKEFTRVGDRVNKGDTVCIVEAMKVMNSIEAEVTGEVVEIFPEPGALVEFGTPLMRIRKA